MQTMLPQRDRGHYKTNNTHRSVKVCWCDRGVVSLVMAMHRCTRSLSHPVSTLNAPQHRIMLMVLHRSSVLAVAV